MPKLYFRYGTMMSSKSANLLMVAHNYKLQGKNILLIKPSVDTRSEGDLIESRCGLSQHADIVLSPEDIDINHITIVTLAYIDAILVDEAQFLKKEQVNRLRKYSNYVPVLCYGLRTDYKGELFEGSKRLMELADTIEEIKTTCFVCNKKAIINAKHNKGKIIKSGDSEIEVGAEDKYVCMCYECWSSRDTIKL